LLETTDQAKQNSEGWM